MCHWGSNPHCLVALPASLPIFSPLPPPALLSSPTVATALCLHNAHLACAFSFLPFHGNGNPAVMSSAAGPTGTCALARTIAPRAHILPLAHPLQVRTIGYVGLRLVLAAAAAGPPQPALPQASNRDRYFPLYHLPTPLLRACSPNRTPILVALG